MSLFRKEALEAQQVSALGRILLFTPRIADVLIALVLLFTFLLLLFVIFGSYTRKATVYGELVPVSGVIKVYPPQGGRIEAVEVQSGARVAKGAVLARINSAVDTAGGDTQARVLAALQAQHDALQENLGRNARAQKEYAAQMTGRREALATQAQMLAGQEKLLASRQGLAAKNEVRYKRLMQQDYVARESYEERVQERLSLDVQLQQAKRERQSVAQQLLSLDNERSQQLDSFSREAHELSRQLAQVEAQIAETESRQAVLLRAPQRRGSRRTGIQEQRRNPRPPRRAWRRRLHLRCERNPAHPHRHRRQRQPRRRERRGHPQRRRRCGPVHLHHPAKRRGQPGAEPNPRPQ